MVEIPMRSSSPHDHNSIVNLNIATQDTKTAQNVISINAPRQNAVTVSAANSNNMPGGMPDSGSPIVSAPQNIAVPRLINQIQKGQKVPLDPANAVKKIKVCLGWNVLNPKCDIDVSAFILGANGKVLGDDWFVFYGQEDSPDKTVHFSLSEGTDREYISVDLSRLNPNANKIVFVLTINEALENKLNFSMVKDAYIRILNDANQSELVSFKMTDYYSNVISMVIGEIYIHNGSWKCNAVGSGIAKDLTGLCELYGVQVI